MYKALIVVEPPIHIDELRSDFTDCGFDVVGELNDASELAQQAVRVNPDLVIAISVSPSALLFEAARMLGTLSPCPFVVFASDGDPDKIRRASDSNIHSYIIDGYAKHRLLSIIQVARARFTHEQILKQEVDGISKKFEERKLVDRAKGLLMRSRGIMEDEAFEMLRSLSMRSRQRIGLVAQSVIDMANAGEAVNRSGQLRMLSQRIVHAYMQVCVDKDNKQAIGILQDCITRVDTNLEILNKSIRAEGFRTLIGKVDASWAPMKKVCGEESDISLMPQLDRFANDMLKNAENLTKFLESSGLVSSLHILNISGRQRMLSQKIIKTYYMLSLSYNKETEMQLEELCGHFSGSLKFLSDAPLQNKKIIDLLSRVSKEWDEIYRAVRDAIKINEYVFIDSLSFSGEKLLSIIEELVAEYEKAMQLLIGDKIGYLH